MTPRDAEAFRILISAIHLAHGKEADEARHRAYLMALSDLPIEAIERGCQKAIRECQFVPTAMDIRQRSGSVEQSDRAELCWSAVLIAIRRQGAYASVDFSDPIVNAVIRHMGGWVKLCETPPDEMVWRKRDFAQHYARFVAMGVTAEQVAPLIGICDGENLTRGFAGHIAGPTAIECNVPPHGRNVRIGVDPPPKRLDAALAAVGRAITEGA